MAVCEIKYFSKSLVKATAATVILPEVETAGPYPVLYLLHGLSDDNSIWQRRTSIERYAAKLPLIIVMPDGGRGFYCDAVEGFAYESAISKDLISFIDRTFQTVSRRTGRCVAGLSMGGYGAVKLALRFPDLFCAASSHSGALGFSHWPNRDDDFGREFARVIGPNPVGSQTDLFALADNIAVEGRPAIRIDCGLDDFLLASNRSFVEHLNTIGYPHVYAEYEGAHTWDYWDEHVGETLEFAAQHLGIQPVG